MPNPPVTCRTCGTPLEGGAEVCPACHTSVVREPAGESARQGPPAQGSAAEPGASGTEPAALNPFATELGRRLVRLTQWSDAAGPLGVELPRLPAWAVEAAGRSRAPEPWAEVVRGVERLAQRRLAEAFDRWEERTSARIARLEAYSVDSRLERGQIEDAVHSAQAGDLAQALTTFQQVDRVVALKERHLDQARAELEGLLAFLRDLEAIGLVDPGEPAKVASELERELRAGRLASLKQRLRLLRSRAVGRIAESLADYVAQVGDLLLTDPRTRAEGDGNARELAVAARAIVQGHPEQGIRRLRALMEARGLTMPQGASTTPGNGGSGSS